jgi:hypothetical protein
MSRKQSDHPPLTHQRLREALDYNPETGVFTWLSTDSLKAVTLIGKPAGGLNALGYWQIGLDHIIYLAHRLAWFWMTGEMPRAGELDHRDLDKTNNRWSNIRRATRTQNSVNKPAQSNNSSGYKGVSRSGNVWRAYIVVERKQIHLGCRADPVEAHALYVAAAKKYYGEFARAA